MTAPAPLPAPPGTTSAPEQKKGKAWKWACGGCGGCGCVTLLVLTIACVSFGQFFWNSFGTQQPLPAGDFTATDEEKEQLRARMEQHAPAWENGDPVELTLTEQEFNTFASTLVEENPNLHVLDAAIRGNRLRLRLSVNPDPNSPVFFNLVFEGTVSYLNGTLDVAADELRIGTEEWSEYVDGRTDFSRDFLRGMAQDALETLRRKEGIELEALEVKADRLHLRLRRTR